MSRIFLILLLLPLGVQAIFDSKSEIVVQAHTVVVDGRSELSTYTGDAKITQGDLLIMAQKIQVFNKEQVVSKIIATGVKKKPAYYKQNQPKQSGFVEATAQKITYFIDKQLVRLEGNAHLTQDSNSFSGGLLNYDIKKNKIIAKKSKDGMQRVKFKIKL
ncbi:MAG: lipopolysaccharide transport periplasmic protein LptA [Gammaproteobacteria bacterium]|uniref:Lipopolysaccharide export system protein LptA n=1 Tax=endosymbiont of Bathymodiolus septemdierum str. Myojin knoll TaxID=1303921 RepID=A0A0P0UPZ5_9GAMM|nr:lipopolysaccharide transport periplasmic protein LptA [Bathymodiolus septemdierum thioautotrophic gill symbiont]RUA06993.1 MAG: lipopolysaccharide transport periplasmic protein LptA [Gammaproteobacteria bacterium]BAS67147.1 lipopolysaccharide export system protein LptA [endosymbiont of Bathymodiolus septemdierum str. Myojin knoll]